MLSTSGDREENINPGGRVHSRPSSSAVLVVTRPHERITKYGINLRLAPTVAYQSPWSNNLQISSAGSNSQPLCKAHDNLLPICDH
jgi:hypothetical protein